MRYLPYIFGAVALTLADAVLALTAFRRLRDRAWLLGGIVLLVASIAVAVATGHQSCPRHNPIVAALATWCPILLLFGVAMVFGWYTAQSVVQRQSRTTLRGLALTAGATAVGLAIGLWGAMFLFIGFYGPDCWP